VAERTIDLIIYDEAGTWSVTSPQIPGFVGGPSREELQRDLPGMLRFVGKDPDGLTLRFHQEAMIPTPDGEMVIRVARDERFIARSEVAKRIEVALTIEVQREDMLDAPRTPTGEVLYICAVPTDTVRWCVAQLHPQGDGAVAAVCVAEEMIWAAHIYVGDGREGRGQPLEHFGYSLDTTLSEIMQSQVILNRPRRLAVSV
jgi:hypothetical protein